MHAVRNELARRVTAATVVAALALAAIACGDSGDGDAGSPAQASSGGSASPDEGAVRDTLEAMSHAMQERDFEAVCRVVTPAVRDQATKWENYPTCAQGMADALTDDPTGKANVVNADMPQVTAIQIRGDTAVVLAKRGAKPVVARVKREDGSWLMERWFSED